MINECCMSVVGLVFWRSFYNPAPSQDYYKQGVEHVSSVFSLLKYWIDAGTRILWAPGSILSLTAVNILK